MLDRVIKISNILLKPLTELYRFCLYLRNKAYDIGLLKSKQHDGVIVISIGNLALGGTGKTPHTEYLIRNLIGKYKLAVLSRGYKRKTKGYILADNLSTSAEIGDEPLQIKHKFNKVLVAVDEKRNRGVEKLLSLPEDIRPEIILLDDAFQHRAIKPDFSILLTKSSNLYVNDDLFPIGRLRESKRGASRADVVIVTKCNENIQPIDLRIISRSLDLLPTQYLAYTKITYQPILPLFPEVAPKNREIEENTEVLLIAGLESPKLMIDEVMKRSKNVKPMIYSDHYALKKDDYKRIEQSFNKLNKKNKMILLSEKDAARIKNDVYLLSEWKQYIYYLPIEVTFLQESEGNDFIKLIEDIINKKNEKN